MILSIHTHCSLLVGKIHVTEFTQSGEDFVAVTDQFYLGFTSSTHPEISFIKPESSSQSQFQPVLGHPQLTLAIYF